MGCHKLGELAEKKGDSLTAWNTYTKACQGGLMISCHKLGILFERGV